MTTEDADHDHIEVPETKNIDEIQMHDEKPEQDLAPAHACVVCTRRCHKMHGDGVRKVNDAPSFVRTATMNSLHNALHASVSIPAAFVESYPEAFEGGNSMTLEGPSGNQWTVKSYKYSGAGFTTGWRAFAYDHRLREGDEIQFTLARPGHFKVDVFNTHGDVRKSALTATKSGKYGGTAAKLGPVSPGLVESRKRKSRGDRSREHEDLDYHWGYRDAFGVTGNGATIARRCKTTTRRSSYNNYPAARLRYSRESKTWESRNEEKDGKEVVTILDSDDEEDIEELTGMSQLSFGSVHGQNYRASKLERLMDYMKKEGRYVPNKLKPPQHEISESKERGTPAPVEPVEKLLELDEADDEEKIDGGDEDKEYHGNVDRPDEGVGTVVDPLLKFTKMFHTRPKTSNKLQATGAMELAPDGKPMSANSELVTVGKSEILGNTVKEQKLERPESISPAKDYEGQDCNMGREDGGGAYPYVLQDEDHLKLVMNNLKSSGSSEYVGGSSGEKTSSNSAVATDSGQQAAHHVDISTINISLSSHESQGIEMSRKDGTRLIEAGANSQISEFQENDECKVQGTQCPASQLPESTKTTRLQISKLSEDQQETKETLTAMSAEINLAQKESLQTLQQETDSIEFTFDAVKGVSNDVTHMLGKIPIVESLHPLKHATVTYKESANYDTRVDTELAVNISKEEHKSTSNFSCAASTQSQNVAVDKGKVLVVDPTNNLEKRPNWPTLANPMHKLAADGEHSQVEIETGTLEKEMKNLTPPAAESEYNEEKSLKRMSSLKDGELQQQSPRDNTCPSTSHDKLQVETKNEMISCIAQNLVEESTNMVLGKDSSASVTGHYNQASSGKPQDDWVIGHVHSCVLVSKRRKVTEVERQRTIKAGQDWAMKLHNPNFIAVMKDSDVYNEFHLEIPSEFTKQAKLPAMEVRVTLLCDEVPRTCKAVWMGSHPKSPRLSTKGWMNFSRTHFLEEGDVCVFELFARTTFRIGVHIFRVVEVKALSADWSQHYEVLEREPHLHH